VSPFHFVLHIHNTHDDDDEIDDDDDDDTKSQRYEVSTVIILHCLRRNKDRPMHKNVERALIRAGEYI